MVRNYSCSTVSCVHREFLTEAFRGIRSLNFLFLAVPLCPISIHAHRCRDLFSSATTHPFLTTTVLALAITDRPIMSAPRVLDLPSDIKSANTPKDLSRWHSNREVLHDLYIRQRKTMKEVRVVMESEHGFPRTLKWVSPHTEALAL